MQVYLKWLPKFAQNMITGNPAIFLVLSVLLPTLDKSEPMQFFPGFKIFVLIYVSVNSRRYHFLQGSVGLLDQNLCTGAAI